MRGLAASAESAGPEHDAHGKKILIEHLLHVLRRARNCDSQDLALC